jgi:predicted phosphodiesterase
MRLAALADIHGNADALEAVLRDVAREGVDAVLVLGDHFSGPLAARECWQQLSHAQAICLRGNHDRYLLDVPRAQMGPSDAAARDDLPPEALDWLASLPGIIALEGVLACHGTPQDDETYLCETLDAGGRMTRRDPTDIARLLQGIGTGLCLCAHSHLPRALQLPDGRQVVNPGSVGCPAYTDTEPVPHIVAAGFPQASYALLERGALGWDVTLRRINYDTRRMVALAAARARPDWAEALATGWITP